MAPRLMSPMLQQVLTAAALSCQFTTAASAHSHQRCLTTNISAPSTYDYVIIGGGTAGLVLANRLSEDNGVTVAVLEAGVPQWDNVNVTDVQNFGLALGTDIDWDYTSTPQPGANGNTIAYHAGKALGGTSTINGMTYIRAETAQIDSWETIGNTGWNWSTMFPYYLKSEHFTTPSPAQVLAGASYNPAYVAFDGALAVGYPWSLSNSSIHTLVNETFAELGIPWNVDANGGYQRGYTLWPSTLDRDANIRESADRAYFEPVASRKNLCVWTNTTAGKIVWDDQRGYGKAVAKGVQLVNGNTVWAKKEVIVSAGSLRSPAILELSGIGNPDILRALDIDTVVALPGVGENLQDQPNVVLAWNSTGESYNGSTPLVGYLHTQDFYNDSTAIPLATANVSDFAATIAALNNNSIPVSVLTQLFTIQKDLLLAASPTVAISNAEIVLFAVGQELASAYWPLIPFSRGTIHITSADPAILPAINPNFFAIDWDLQFMVTVAKYIRAFWNTLPLGSIVGGELLPGLDTLPLNATDEAWAKWLKGAFASNSHPIGTAAMMSQELGGVVDPTLLVYGTANVRVIDASVMPFQVSGHLTSTIYAIAERAADIIRGKQLLA